MVLPQYTKISKFEIVFLNVIYDLLIFLIYLNNEIIKITMTTVTINFRI